MKESTIGHFPRITRAWVNLLGAIIIGLSSILVNYTACDNCNGSENDSEIQAWFTPQDPCMDLVIDKILSAKFLILVQAYVITSHKIADALIKAYRNGIEVKLLIYKDAQTTKGSKVNQLLASGMPIIIDKAVGYAHNKVMIIDETYVITGSFNWTHSAQARNAENLVIIKGKKINRRFKVNWYMRAAAGKPLGLLANRNRL